MSLLKKNSATLGMLILFSCAFSQQQETISPKFKAVKIFTHSDFVFEKNASNFISLLRTFSPTLAWGKEYGDFHEIGIQDVNVQLNDFSKNLRTTINYSYNTRIGRGMNPDQKVKFYAGLGGQVNLSYDRNPAYSSTSFHNKYSNQSFQLQFIPRVTFRLSKNMMLDVNIPYGVYSFSRFSYTTENPRILVEHRKNVYSKSTTFPNEFTVRVGVSIKF